MPEELNLPGIPRPRLPTDHLFLAIFPDGNTARFIEQIATQQRTGHELGNKQLATDRFHVSLYSLGTYSGVPEIIVRAASKAAMAVAASTPPFKVKFNRAVSFTGS